MRPERRWPLALAAVLVLAAAGNGVAIWLAYRDGAPAVEPDYYRRALAWDSSVAAAARGRALGWRLAVTLAAPAPRSALEVAVRDSAGAAVAGAVVRAEGFAVARAAVVIDTVLAEAGPGRYLGALSVARAEWHEFRFTVGRGEDRFVARVRCLPGRECIVR
jgi:hypothetical protein